jgi:hypothetical protein
MFRRKQEDEDPFAALKDAAERGSATVTTGNESASASVGGDRDERASTQVTGVPGTAPDRRGSNRFLVVLTIVLSLGGAAALVWASEPDGPAGAAAVPALVGDDAPPQDRPSKTSSGKAEPPPPRHHDLLRPAAFRQALHRIQQRLMPGERVWLLRLAQNRINANTRLRDGRQRLIDVDDGLSVAATAAGSAGSRRGIALSRIDPDAPARAQRKAAAQGRFSARKLDYLVMNAPVFPGDPPDWSLFFSGVSARNSHWIASLDGRTVSRPGEQPGADGGDSLTIRTDAGTTTLTGEQARQVNACIRGAGTDGRKIRECLP